MVLVPYFFECSMKTAFLDCFSGLSGDMFPRPDQKDRLVKIMVQETTTLGIRFRYSQRIVLDRSNEEIESPWGKIGVKRVIQDEVARLVPEYDVCRKIALKHNIPLREIYQWIESLNIAH